jgi:hypothetical protein
VRLYWFGPPESNTYVQFFGLYFLRVVRFVGLYKGVALSALYWPADEVVSLVGGDPGVPMSHTVSRR